MRPASPSRAASGRAFTLVELLVVVAIVALLVSILLPALGSARIASRGVVCLANLRQQAVAVHSYRGDSSGCYPLSVQNMNPDGTHVALGFSTSVGYFWMGAIDRYVGSPLASIPAASVNFATTMSIRFGVLQCPDGVGARNAIPADTQLPGFSHNQLNLPQYAYNQGFGFYSESAVTGTGARWRGLLRDPDSPSKAVVSLDAWVGWQAGTNNPVLLWPNNGRPLMRHGSAYTFKPKWLTQGSLIGGAGYQPEASAGGYRHAGFVMNRVMADGHANSIAKENTLIADFALTPHVYPFRGDGVTPLANGYP